MDSTNRQSGVLFAEDILEPTRIEVSRTTNGEVSVQCIPLFAEDAKDLPHDSRQRASQLST